MNDFEKNFNRLDSISKMAINAYRSGREFQILGNNIMDFRNIIGHKHPTIVASVVNEIFACELYFKSILMIQKHEIVKGHELVSLYNQIQNINIKAKMINYNFDEELNKINDSFEKWRYCYESKQLIIYTGFLYDLCKVLEEESRILIYNEYNLDMNKSFI